jgi:hypothetical protein
VIRYEIDENQRRKTSGSNSNRRKTMEEKDKELLTEDVDKDEVEEVESTEEPEQPVEAETVVEEEGADAVVEEPTEDGIEPEIEQPTSEKMLTQSQVNELVGRARQEGRDSAMRELFTRYGVSGDEELNDLFGRGQTYSDLEAEFSAQGDNYRATLAENALLKSKTDESRWDDIRLILGGKGLDVTVDNIESLMPSHPEWRTMGQQAVATADPTMVTREVVDEMSRQQQVEPEKKATVRRLGGEATPVNDVAAPMESEEEKLRRLFGV